MLAGILCASITANAQSLSERAQGILAQHCFGCHGAEKQKGGLRLDNEKDALWGGDSAEASYVPGKSKQSILIQKIIETNPQKRMPAGKPALSAKDIKTLTDWVDQGAAWTKVTTQEKSKGPSHWSFIPPTRIDAPELPKNFPVINPIDAFIGEKIKAQGLTPMSEADRTTLVRRVYLETIGLPTTPKQTQDFVNDKWPGAYKRLLNRLFKSPHYGERQAQQWLDIARFADTNGYEKDKPRSIWPYRDWVIDAYNNNMPFDQFVIEQLAGDLLPSPSNSQIIATGFHRNTMLNEEGGIDAAEDWFKRTVDRTNTTSAAFLGLTVGCAQCHTHKSDPITRTEYYRLFAFFNNAQEDNYLLPDADIKAKRSHAADLIEKSKDWTVFLAKQNDKAQAEYAKWLSEVSPKASDWVVHPPTSIHSRKDTPLKTLDDHSVLAYGDVPNDDTYTLEFEVGRELSAIRLEVLPHESLHFGGPGRGNLLADGDFLLSGFEAHMVDESGEVTPINITSATHDYAAENRSAQKSLDGLSDTGWSINGQVGKAHCAVYQLEKPVRISSTSTLKLVLHQDYIHQHTIGRLRIATTMRNDLAEALKVPAHIETALFKGAKRSDSDQALIERHFYSEHSKELEKWRTRREKIHKEQPSYTSTLVMAKRIPERITHVHNRGEFQSPKQVVDSGVPKVLHDFPEGSQGTRLDLAHWLVSRENPLLARVTMNRLWQQVFGKGLVATSEDFGIEGEAPSHSELLDWLAIEFMDSGWDLQYMHRLMLMSSTFRRQSEVTPQILEKDPDNTYLARGPRLRLDAEVIRDLALSTSGLLVPDIGGPSVFPPQPAGANSLAYGTPAWPTSKGDDRYRRGIYTYIKRTAPYPGATVFDAPTREESCLRRQRTNTPLQALTLLNDEVYMEAMRNLAKAIQQMDGNVEEKTNHLYMLMMSRAPETDEIAHIEQFFTTQHEHFSKNDSAARKLLGLKKDESNEATSEWAAWTALCRVILNTDEVITRS